MALSGANAGNIGRDIQDWWSNEWGPKNKEWVRVWNRGHEREFTEVLRYDEEFADAPQFVSCDESQFRFRLLGKSTAKWWKDWIALRVIPDVQARFPGVGKVVNARNCDEPPTR